MPALSKQQASQSKNVRPQNPKRGKSSWTWTNSWVDGSNTILTFTQEQTQSFRKHLMPSRICLLWRTSTPSPPRKNLVKPSMRCQTEKHRVKMAYLLKSSRSASLLQPLHELLRPYWREGGVPQDMRDSLIITLYKNKGDRSDCNNYQRISLLSIVDKIFARVVQSRLQILASRIPPESQCGFKTKRTTVDKIFSIRQLQEKCREQQMPIYIAFVDLTKAFDFVCRSGLFQLLKKIGCPPNATKLHCVLSRSNAW